jgi:hypothetical protein
MGEVMTVPVIHLYGGECDGYRQKVRFTTRPEVFYAVPLLDMERIRKTVKPTVARETAIEEARRLAYTFKKIQVGGDDVEYRYERAPDQDKLEDL